MSLRQESEIVGRQRPWASLAAATALLATLAAPPVTAAGDPRFEGLWRGEIIYAEAEREFEITVEIGRDLRGELVGTIDLPAMSMLYHQLEYVRTEGDSVSFEFRRHSETRGEDAPFVFNGKLADDGQRVSGEFVEFRGAIPFNLRRAGEAGDPRLEIKPRPVVDLADNALELKEAFNRDRGEVRFVMLLSPT